MYSLIETAQKCVKQSIIKQTDGRLYLKHVPGNIVALALSSRFLQDEHYEIFLNHVKVHANRINRFYENNLLKGEELWFLYMIASNDFLKEHYSKLKNKLLDIEYRKDFNSGMWLDGNGVCSMQFNLLWKEIRRLYEKPILPEFNFLFETAFFNPLYKIFASEAGGENFKLLDSLLYIYWNHSIYSDNNTLYYPSSTRSNITGPIYGSAIYDSLKHHPLWRLDGIVGFIEEWSESGVKKTNDPCLLALSLVVASKMKDLRTESDLVNYISSSKDNKLNPRLFNFALFLLLLLY